MNLAQCPFPASNLGIRGSESRRKRDPLAEVFVEWRVDSVRERENLSMYLCSRAVMPSASLQETVRPVQSPIRDGDMRLADHDCPNEYVTPNQS